MFINAFNNSKVSNFTFAMDRLFDGVTLPVFLNVLVLKKRRVLVNAFLGFAALCTFKSPLKFIFYIIEFHLNVFSCLHKILS